MTAAFFFLPLIGITFLPCVVERHIDGVVLAEEIAGIVRGAVAVERHILNRGRTDDLAVGVFAVSVTSVIHSPLSLRPNRLIVS